MDSILRGVQGPGVRPITGPPTGPVTQLLEETETFRDRVKSKTNGEIETGALENLYDPILREAKSAGWDSDLVFFGAGSAVENVSGSIATIFDASGNKDDATQGTSSNRPTLNKTGIGGHWVADFDGSDDAMTTSGISASTPITVYAVGQQTSLGGYLHDGDSSTGSERLILNGDRNGNFAHFNGSWLESTAADTNVHRWGQIFDGASSEIFQDGSSIATGDAGTGSLNGLTMGSIYSESGAFWPGPIQMIIVVNAKLSGTELLDVDAIVKNFNS